jgi:hypothetical protein
MDATYREPNDATLTRLRTLVKQFTPEDLDRPVGDGLTLKVALLHLAWWDRFAAAVAQEWQIKGYIASGHDDAYINQAALNDWLAASPEYALSEVVRAAEVSDHAAAGIGDALRADIVAGGEGWVCERGVHRTEHIEQIEQASGRLAPSKP